MSGLKENTLFARERLLLKKSLDFFIFKMNSNEEQKRNASTYLVNSSNLNRINFGQRATLRGAELSCELTRFISPRLRLITQTSSESITR